MIVEEKVLMEFLLSLPHYGTVRSRIDFGRQFWFIDMPDEWQNAKDKIVDLLRDIHRDRDLPANGQASMPASAEDGFSETSVEKVVTAITAMSMAEASCETVSLQTTGKTIASPYCDNVADTAIPAAMQESTIPSSMAPSTTSPAKDSFAVLLQRSADKLRTSLESQNIPYEKLGFYGPLRNMHISIRGPGEEGRRVNLIIRGFCNVEHGAIGHPSIQENRVFHARRFSVRVVAEAEITKRHKKQPLHITLGYYGTRSIAEEPEVAGCNPAE